jgi:ABC-2 type transport system permease protein
MNSFKSLLTLYARFTYDPARYLEFFRQGPKGVAKGVGYAALFIYVIVVFAAMFVLQSVSAYTALKPLGLERLVILNGSVAATAIVAVIGFITVLTTYYTSGAEQQLLSLPIRPRDLFSVKFIMTYLAEAALALLLLASSMGVYAWFEHPGALYYVYGVLIALATPLLPLALLYCIFVPVMSLSPFFRRKDTVMLVGGVLGIGLAIGWQIIYQRFAINLNSPSAMATLMAGPDSYLSKASALFPPALWAASALGDSTGLSGLGWFLAYLGVEAGASCLAILLLSRAYAASLLCFGEAGVKHLARSEEFIRARLSRRDQLSASLHREFVLMIREPVYFMNGPFMVLFMPIFFGVMIVTTGKDLGPALLSLSAGVRGSILSIGTFGLAAFLGSMTCVTSTSVSREGTQLAFLKSLPLDYRAFVWAKLLHGLTYCFASACMAFALAAWIFPSGVASFILPTLSGFCLAALLNILGLFLDFAFPRLTWANPTAAMKQNPNTMVAVLGGMGLVIGFCVLAGIFNQYTFIVPAIGVTSLVATVALAFSLGPFAQSRLEAIEI